MFGFEGFIPTLGGTKPPGFSRGGSPTWAEPRAEKK
jgi:hypothetical protein